jgi:hypothetical protein
MIGAAHASGVKFLCATLTSFEPDQGWTQPGEIRLVHPRQ